MKKILFIFLFSLFLSCANFLDKKAYEFGRDRLINYIETEYSGIVINKITFRVNMEPTHFVTNLKDTIAPSNALVIKNLNIGDSIFKPTNDNYLYIYGKDKNFKGKYWFMKIPEKIRQDSLFPKEWRCKWMDSTK